MKPLHEDQIHNGPFMELCTHIWSDDATRREKSGVWDYYYIVSKKLGKPLVDHTNFPKSGVIFVGMCHLLEDIFNSIPTTGNYIFIHRTNDRPFTQKIYDCKPKSVKHIYTVDCQVNKPDVSAIPFGNSSINGEDEILKEVINGDWEWNLAPTKLFVRYNVNSDTPHRNESLKILRGKPFAKVIEKQIPVDEFYRQVAQHTFTMALAGCGADASRQWAAIQLGSIPIVTDCPEMRHFEDLPLIYCPKDMNEITEEWLDKQNVTGKSTERMRMSYWENHLNEMKNKYGI